jgi:hypothetical protein
VQQLIYRGFSLLLAEEKWVFWKDTCLFLHSGLFIMVSDTQLHPLTTHREMEQGKEGS